jgi:hypothetical protein
VVVVWSSGVVWCGVVCFEKKKKKKKKKKKSKSK